jgi:hypothetical protein
MNDGSSRSCIARSAGAIDKITERDYARAATLCATLAERLERVDAGQITR